MKPFLNLTQWLLISIFVVTLNSCKKDHDNSTVNVVSDAEILSDEEYQSLDNCPDVELSLSDIILPNGENASEFLPDFDTAFFSNLRVAQVNESIKDLKPLTAKNFLIKELSAVALSLVDRSKHQYVSEGPGKPAQDGLAYVYGSRDYSARINPRGGCKDEALYGLDCSGLMYQLFKKAGIESFPSSTADEQRKVKSIEKSLSISLPQLKKIKVEDLGQLESTKFKTGDLVYWINKSTIKDNTKPHETGIAQHIGMVLKTTGGKLAIFQSNGDPRAGVENCAKNQGAKRGPRTIELDDSYWFGPNKVYGIVRFNFEIEGKWSFHFKCSDRENELFQLELNFPPANSKEFSLTQEFQDYDGSTNNANFDFKYDNTTNMLSCDFTVTDGSIPNFERKDSFTISLEKDDSGFTSAKNIYINNGTGCAADVKLVNLE